MSNAHPHLLYSIYNNNHIKEDMNRLKSLNIRLCNLKLARNEYGDHNGRVLSIINHNMSPTRNIHTDNFSRHFTQQLVKYAYPDYSRLGSNYSVLTTRPFSSSIGTTQKDVDILIKELEDSAINNKKLHDLIISWASSMSRTQKEDQTVDIYEFFQNSSKISDFVIECFKNPQIDAVTLSNLLLENLTKFNFSIVNKVLNHVSINDLSVHSMSEILKSNPGRAKPSWEFFLEFIEHNDKLKMTSIDNESIDAQMVANPVFNAIIENLINSDESSKVEEALSIPIASKILYLFRNFRFQITEKVKVDKVISMFSESHMLSLLLVSITDQKKLAKLQISKDEIFEYLRKEVKTRGTTEDKIEDLVFSLAYMGQAIGLDLKSDVSFSNNSLALFKRFIKDNSEDGTINTIGTSAKVSELDKKIDEINKKFDTLSSNSHSKKLELFNKAQYSKSEFLLGFLNPLIEILNSNIQNHKDKKNIGKELAQLKSNILLLEAVELFKPDDSLVELNSSIISYPDHADKLNLTGLLISVYHALKHDSDSAANKKWNQLASIFVPQAVNYLHSNIADLEKTQSKLAIEEIHSSLTCLRLLIILNSEINFSNSVDFFNNNIEAFKRYDQLTQKGTVPNTLYFSTCFYMIDSLIKSALLRNERELAYVIYEKSMENKLILEESESEKMELKKNFKKFGDGLDEDKNIQHFKNYVLNDIRSIKIYE
ncbi:hypothetical protein DASC09_023760 [Saccharomycopsis crataegensis]|uniref:Uncharacterized protein n=1 Tax=Saccharomycopsis crataegensis TaxID=43959 RepID=A0AAV5QK39_9ASCO|nr:hypothetical protein DASC09_023760 [Saccharomycopsis crataegensis]